MEITFSGFKKTKNKTTLPEIQKTEKSKIMKIQQKKTWTRKQFDSWTFSFLFLTLKISWFVYISLPRFCFSSVQIEIKSSTNKVLSLQSISLPLRKATKCRHFFLSVRKNKTTCRSFETIFKSFLFLFTYVCGHFYFGQFNAKRLKLSHVLRIEWHWYCADHIFFIFSLLFLNFTIFIIFSLNSTAALKLIISLSSLNSN